MKSSTINRISLISALLFFAMLFVPTSVSATRDQGNGHKTTICHRTNSVTNPYRVITVDYAAINGRKNNDHSHHTGPVATSQTVAQNLKDAKTKWGDIIPPVSGVNGGQNWTNEGQNIYNNGCKYIPSQDAPTDNDTPNDDDDGQVLGDTSAKGAGTLPETLPKTGLSATASTVLATVIMALTGTAHYLVKRPKLQ